MASEQKTMQFALTKAVETAKPEVLKNPQRFLRILEDLCPKLQGEIEMLSRIYTKELGNRVYDAYEGAKQKKKDAWKPVQQYLEEEMALNEERCQEVLQWFSGKTIASGKTGAAATGKTASTGKAASGNNASANTTLDQAARQRLATTLNMATQKASQLWKQSFEEAQKAERDGNIVRAVQLYKSIQDGAAYERDAQKRLGIINEKNPGDAYAYFLRAAKLGDAESAFRVGHMLENGRGVTANVQEAIKYYEKAVSSGNAMAMHSLGYLYYMGKGIAQNYQRAFDWFQMAALKGLGMSMRNMGVMYENGVYVSRDLAQALTWYRKAEKNGYAAAADDCARVRKKMNQR